MGDRVCSLSNRLLLLLVAAIAIFGMVRIAAFVVYGCRNATSWTWFARSCTSGEHWPSIAAGTSLEPRKHVYFLKTHKCASTTVQRVLLTHAIRHNLSIALPLKRINNFYPEPFRPEAAKRTCAYPHFDIMAAHARFDLNSRRVMPHDTLFVSIVRDPVEQMESSYYYFLVNQCRKFPSAGRSFESYLQTLVSESPRSRKPLRPTYPCNAALMKFLQLHEFGLKLRPHPTKALVEAKIREIDESFHLVLVVERLDEGLIMMRDMLRWTTNDILYLKSNFRLKATKHVSAAVRRAAYSWNWGDKLLYDHFRDKMDGMIREQEEYLRVQVREFRALQASFHKHCVDGVVRAKQPVAVGARRSVRTSSYVLSESGKLNYTCRLAAMSEIELFRHLNSLEPTCAVPAGVIRGSATPASRAQPTE